MVNPVIPVTNASTRDDRPLISADPQAEYINELRAKAGRRGWFTRNEVKLEHAVNMVEAGEEFKEKRLDQTHGYQLASKEAEYNAKLAEHADYWRKGGHRGAIKRAFKGAFVDAPKAVLWDTPKAGFSLANEHILQRPKAAVTKAGKYALGAGVAAAGIAWAANTFLGGASKSAASAVAEAKDQAVAAMGGGILTADQMMPPVGGDTLMGLPQQPGEMAARVRGNLTENKALPPRMTAASFEDAGEAARRINKPAEGLASGLTA